MADDPHKPKDPPGDVWDRHAPGHLVRDAKGNVTWSWSDESLQDDDTRGAAERMRALVDPKLDVVDDPDPRLLQSNPKGLKQGYDPYDSGELGKQSWKKKKNLKELSNWIELRKRVTGKKKEGE
jgi:hypothetical protein